MGFARHYYSAFVCLCQPFLCRNHERQIVICNLTRTDPFLQNITALYGQKEVLYMSEKANKVYTFKEREWVVTGWAEGRMEVERDEGGRRYTEMQPYYHLFVLSPVSSFKSDNYSANGLKAEKLRCVSNAVWKDLHPMEVVNLYFDDKKRVALASSTGVSVGLIPVDL